MTHPDPKNFFIGRTFDLASGKTTDENVFYNPADLTTHGVVTGMTGSGKTGLCIGLLEEAALKGLPAIIIDPKGDLTNLVLHFPDLLPADFEPWIDPDQSRQQGKEISVIAAETAENWKKGLSTYGLGSEELTALKNFNFCIYTPGSSAGVPINILSSFAAPEISWEENQEVLREKIASTVTAVLGLVGMTDLDPLRSREHILLSNILEHAWSNGQSLTLTDLILAVQKPSFDRLGAFPLDHFFPEKDRFELAMLLNNFLASPSFQVWQQGQTLNIQNLLYTSDGKPRHSIFYLAHLSENERMFFVTLLFSAVESWMRNQRGTSGLRAIVYFDEILGYLPPVGNPPSRLVMLRMIKQARAFGVGLLLATQNPVDLDYKALSNIGTWMIGRLQTERDKARLMDGLSTLTGGVDTAQIGDMIASLGKRVFLLHNVNKSGPRVFSTRWALNFLAGPMTRTQIPALNQLAGVAQNNKSAPAKKPAAPTADQAAAEPVRPAVSASAFSTTRPALPTGINEFFLPAELKPEKALKNWRLALPPGTKPKGILYRPVLAAQAEIRYFAAKYEINSVRKITTLVPEKPNGRIDWESYTAPAMNPRALDQQPERNAFFAPLPGWLSDLRAIKPLSADFEDWVYRAGKITLRANELLKVYGTPDEEEDTFTQRCIEAAKKEMDVQLDKLEEDFKKRTRALQEKIRKQEGEVDVREEKVSQKTVDALGTAGSTLLGMFLGGRKRSLSSSVGKVRQRSEAKSLLDREKKELEDLQKQLDELEQEFEEAQEKLAGDWDVKAKKLTEVPLTPQKKDIFIDMFGVAWLPYYLFDDNGTDREVPAYGTEE